MSNVLFLSSKETIKYYTKFFAKKQGAQSKNSIFFRFVKKRHNFVQKIPFSSFSHENTPS